MNLDISEETMRKISQPIQPEKFYRTQNLYQGSFLLAKGFKLAGKEKSLAGKITLLFEENDSLRLEAMKFFNGGKVEAKAYSDSYRTLKDFIFEKE